MKTYLLMLVILTSLALISCSPEPGKSDNQTSDAAESQIAQTATPEVVPSTPSCSFKMGFDVWEPYQYVDVDGVVRGLDIELISNVLEDIGCQAEFVQGTWVNLLEDLRNGDVDMLLGASKTDAREEFAYFSEPYRMEEFSLYIRKDDPKRAAYDDIDAFIANGSKIGVVGDYYYGPRISILLDGNATSKFFVSGIMGELNVARLLDMDIDGFLEDSFVGASMVRRKALGDYIVAHGFTVETGDIYVMFSRASVTEEQVNTFSQALDTFKNSASYTEIVGKYSQ